MRAISRRIIPIVNASGPDFDKGELQRYLAELAWCPYAVLNNKDLVFEPVDGYAFSFREKFVLCAVKKTVATLQNRTSYTNLAIHLALLSAILTSTVEVSTCFFGD